MLQNAGDREWIVQGSSWRAVLPGITLYWQCDNAGQAATLLLKGLHGQCGVAALGENGGKWGRPGVHACPMRFLFASESQDKQAGADERAERMFPLAGGGVRWWKSESKKAKRKIQRGRCCTKIFKQIPSQTHCLLYSQWHRVYPLIFQSALCVPQWCLGVKWSDFLSLEEAASNWLLVVGLRG